MRKTRGAFEVVFGIILIAKPPGCTSHDVVDQVRRLFHTRRVGHAGTLDPQASGLLVVAIGPATRFLQFLPLEPKRYVADFTFGRSTNTFDLEGETTLEGPLPENLPEAAREAAKAFTGLIQQLPPMFSAVKVKGKPLYSYARQGKSLEREPRTVHVGVFDLLHAEGATLRFEIECSGGTYVRSLANDLGTAMGCGAHLSALERVRVGRFTIEQAVAVEEARPERVMSLRDALPPMPLVPLTDTQTAHVRDGRPVILQMAGKERLVALLDPSGNVFSVARKKGEIWQPECVIPAEVQQMV